VRPRRRPLGGFRPLLQLAPLLAKPAAAPAQPALLQVRPRVEAHLLLRPQSERTPLTLHYAQVMPVVANLLAPILSKYGFAPDQGGLMQFVVGGSRYKDDEEVTALASSMRERVVPPEMMPMLSAMLAVQQQNAGQ